MWDPELYMAYAPYRRRPVEDLLGRIVTDPVHRIIDLGCGPGNLTGVLHARWPTAAIVGVERDEAMLDRARAAESSGDVRYEAGDLSSWEPDGPVDLVFSNAALHWVPDHLDLLTRFVGWLAPGGTLAVQVPGNTEAPTHRTVAEVRSSPRWRDRVGEGADSHLRVHSPEDYARALAGPGVVVDAWETTYVHQLTGPDPVTNWVAGSTLRPVLTALDEDDQAAFLADVSAGLAPHYPPDAHGNTWMPFRRIFFVARVGA